MAKQKNSADDLDVHEADEHMLALYAALLECVMASAKKDKLHPVKAVAVVSKVCGILAVGAEQTGALHGDPMELVMHNLLLGFEFARERPPRVLQS